MTDGRGRRARGEGDAWSADGRGDDPAVEQIDLPVGARDVARIATLTSQLLERGSKYAYPICEVCARACQELAKACEKHSKVEAFARCAEACHKCAQECSKLAKQKKKA